MEASYSLVRPQGRRDDWQPARRTGILLSVMAGAAALTALAASFRPLSELRHTPAQLAQLASQVSEVSVPLSYDEQSHDAIHSIIGDTFNHPQEPTQEADGELYYNASSHDVADDYPGCEGLLDSFAIMDIESQTVIEAAEYCFARMNQDRALCSQPAYSYYEIVSAEAGMIGAGGIRYWLRLQIDHHEMADYLVKRLPDYEDRITTSTTHEGLIPNLLGQFQLLQMHPSPCPEPEGPEEHPEPEHSAESGHSKEAAHGDGEGHDNTEEIHYPQDNADHDKAKGEPEKQEDEHPEVDIHFPQGSEQNVSNSSSGTEIDWPPQEKVINSQKLSWVAKTYDHLRHMTLQEFQRTRLGFKAPSEAQVLAAKSQTTILSVEGMPDYYDASDRFTCKAFDIQDQKSCGSCYAFAAASSLSARLCAASQGQYDVNLSPQHMVSCNGEDGCEGGNAAEVYKPMEETGRVSDWCMPYQALDANDGGPACKKACAEGQRFEVLPDSVGVIQQNVEAMQAEILLNGPVFGAFYTYPDFMAYKGGVYSVSDSALKQGKVGGHAAMIIGWGTDADSGEDYWLLQNSWSKNWGENGRFRIRRGTDECSIESFGVWFATPELPKQCGSKRCSNGGELLKDCSCKCSGGWSGSSCDHCSLRCSDGGKLDPRSCSCVCKPGFTGKHCELELVVDSSVACVGGETWPTVTWNIEAEADRFVPGAYLQVFPKDVVPWTASRGWAKASSKPLRLCGEKEDWAPGKKCEGQGQFHLPELAAGEYTVWYAKYLGNNEFGVSRGYQQPLQRIWPDIKVTKECGNLAQIARESARQCVIDAQKEWWQVQEEAAERASERKRRADAAEQAALKVKAPAATSLDAPDIVFGSLPIVYSVPDWKDSDPPSNKEFGLFPEGESSSWYPMGSEEGKRKGSMNFEVSGVPPGKYSLAMFCMGSRAASRDVVVASTGMGLQYSYNSAMVKAKVSWDRKPIEVLGTNMWVGVWKKGAPLSQPLKSLKIPAGSPATGSTDFVLDKDDSAGIGPGSELEVKMYLSNSAVVSEGEFKWP